MKIIEPTVELWENTYSIAHVARCARVCYGKEQGDDNKLYNSLLLNNHYSMFRHDTIYIILNDKSSDESLYYATIIYNTIYESNTKLAGIDITLHNGAYYIVVNGNWLLDNFIIKARWSKYIVDAEYFANTEIGFNMMRYTFCITTQISTSRELNRVSPNNISEQSTRYVYENGCICRPHWITAKDVRIHNENEFYYFEDNAQNYLYGCKTQFELYKALITGGLKKQDARGLLPLDTATRCVYTYSIDEWRDIINLRYYGITGVPHPNAKIIAGMIRNKLIELGYEFE